VDADAIAAGPFPLTPLLRLAMLVSRPDPLGPGRLYFLLLES